jgi:carotenoid 1,2-hydratase
MATAAQKVTPGKFSYTSSIALDMWKPKTDSKSFEWWYFDALSENGRDAVVIIFLDNFIFSPRYNSSNRKKIKSENSGQFPAIAFLYYRDGKPVYRAINEYNASEFSAEQDFPSCKIGNSSFTFKSAPYGSGYFVSINTKLSKNRSIEAHFEWLSIESDFLPDKKINQEDAHIWNLVVARSDVTGRITVSDEKGKDTDVIHFRGTGYHDHNSDNRWLPETVCDWQTGRAHFADATAVFLRFKERNEQNPLNKLFTIRDGLLHERDAVYEETNFTRHKLGLKYPMRQTFLTEDNIRLRIKNQQIIDSSFFYLRFLSEMTLTLRDGKPRKTVGITEYFAPKALKYRWLDWIVNMRIGRNGKGSLFT